MPTLADNSICIRRWDFSETSQVVSHFTREHGVIRGLAKGAKRERSAFSGGMDVLTRGQIVAIVKPGRDLATLTQWTLEEVYWAIRHNLAANRAGLYMADLVHHMLTEHDPHPPLFDALTDALRKIEQPAKIGESLLEFQWAALRETGYWPELTRTRRPASPGASSPPVAAHKRHGEGKPLLFSPHAGGVIEEQAGDAKPSAPSGPTWRVRPETIDLLRRVEGGETLAEADPETIARANRLLAAYIREVLGREVSTMRWAFPDLSR